MNTPQNFYKVDKIPYVQKIYKLQLHKGFYASTLFQLSHLITEIYQSIYGNLVTNFRRNY